MDIGGWLTEWHKQVKLNPGFQAKASARG